MITHTPIIFDDMEVLAAFTKHSLPNWSTLMVRFSWMYLTASLWAGWRGGEGRREEEKRGRATPDLHCVTLVWAHAPPEDQWRRPPHPALPRCGVPHLQASR